MADAQRYKVEVEATGQASAVTTVYSAILNANPDDRVIALQYLDTLKQMANGQAAKIFIPYEATAILGALGGIQEVLKDVPSGSPRGSQTNMAAMMGSAPSGLADAPPTTLPGK